jgi:hypothetical protein
MNESIRCSRNVHRSHHQCMVAPMLYSLSEAFCTRMHTARAPPPQLRDFSFCFVFFFPSACRSTRAAILDFRRLYGRSRNPRGIFNCESRKKNPPLWANCVAALAAHTFSCFVFFYEEDERVDMMFQECAPVSPPVYGRPHAVFSLRGILHPHAHGTSPTPTAA